MQSRLTIDGRQRDPGNGSSGAASSLHLRLRIGTAAAHRELEERLALVDQMLSTERYRDVLQMLYGFYAPLEARLVKLTPLVPISGLSLRARAPLLVRDLLALGLSQAKIAELPRCGELPPTSGAEHLAGCLYVIEGASLGGQIIRRAIAGRSGPSLAHATAFFTGDGAATAARWRCVLEWLDAHEAAGAQSEQIVAAARETFERLTRWMKMQDVA